MKIFMHYTSLTTRLLKVGLLLVLTSCQPTFHKLEPTLSLPLPTSRISSLPSAFPSLSLEESKQDWAKELLLGNFFAKESDFYRAITCYKRSLILLPPQETSRRLQLDYCEILCYYLGGKYQEALNLFASSDLSQANPSFPAFNNLLLMIFECYLQTKQEDKAECVRQVIEKYSSESAEDVLLYQTLKSGEVENTRSIISTHRNAEELEKEFAFYEQFAKSPRLARTLNAILPGAGYYYVGQRRSAVTSFIINALFTAASYQFFQRGYPAAGAITLSLEMGWYFGGINGAGIEAQEFNTRLFEGMSKKMLGEHECFPLLMFETSF